MYEAFEKMRSITVKNFNQNFRIDSVNKIDFVIVEKEDIPKLIEILNILKGR
jgi:HD superfamily phosphohydrolase YqeK